MQAVASWQIGCGGCTLHQKGQACLQLYKPAAADKKTTAFAASAQMKLRAGFNSTEGTKLRLHRVSLVTVQ